jgi:outer membrane protein assembly factor BamB
MKYRAALACLLLLSAFTVAWPIAAAAARIPRPVGGASAGLQARTISAGLKTPIVTNGSWPVYHRDDGHTGSDPTLPPVAAVRPGWTSAVLDDRVFASPLVYGGIVYAATLNNTVYAMNQIDGSPVWTTHIPRVPVNGGWGCGFQASPQGILGTPAIDPITGRIFVVTLDNADKHYRLEGLNLLTGVEEVNTDISAFIGVAFDWTIHQQRGALAVANGYVYVPFGGRGGDCGDYHGWVFAVPTNGTPITHYYVTPGHGSGFWSAGGVVVDDSTGKVFVTSGNAVGGTGPGGGCEANPDGTPVFENDAVIRLSSTLVHEDFFMPVDWQANWCANDMDLGGAAPLLMSPSLLFQSGKWGTGFLLNPTGLGGIDGQRFPTPTGTAATSYTCFGNVADATFASFAYAAPFVYVECEGRGLVALNVNTGTPSFGICNAGCPAPDWHAGSGLTFGPPIVAAGAVWVADNGGGLYAYRADTGALIYHSASFGIERFVTLAEAGGQVFVPSVNVIRSFVMGFGVLQSASAPPAPPRPIVQTGAGAQPGRLPVSQSGAAPRPFGR